MLNQNWIRLIQTACYSTLQQDWVNFEVSQHHGIWFYLTNPLIIFCSPRQWKCIFTFEHYKTLVLALAFSQIFIDFFEPAISLKNFCVTFLFRKPTLIAMRKISQQTLTINLTFCYIFDARDIVMILHNVKKQNLSTTQFWIMVLHRGFLFNITSWTNTK